ncbi:hypothetical protein BpHYR1_037139 [Brachionus plicatilis]|uniref:Uncharacterized protein n=1 Tax=Brachionus plicatilis TaxID=10195 RepID=A0A3M7T285_BRAPC|nr:hypothetical protein BpHYR1_037139 [Brachionus plicatilis]
MNFLPVGSSKPHLLFQSHPKSLINCLYMLYTTELKFRRKQFLTIMYCGSQNYMECDIFSNILNFELAVLNFTKFFNRTIRRFPEEVIDY